MRNFVVIMCILAITAGFVVGRVEHEAEKAAVSERAGTEATPIPSRVEQAREPRDRRHSRRNVEASFPDSAPVDAVEKKENAATPSSAVPTALLRDPSFFRGRLEGIQALLSKQDFSGAEKEARALEAETASGSPAIHDQAVRLSAKARVFGRLVQSIPSDPPLASIGRSLAVEVVLSNGSTITASKLGEEADRFIFKLREGGVFCPGKEDVLEVRPVEGQPNATSGWKTLEAKISKLDHSIDIFVDGVERCYRSGFKQEGLQVLEQLAARPDSDSIPLLFVPDADEALLRDWRIAGGRVSASPGRPQSVTSLPAASVKKEPEAEEGVARPRIFGLEEKNEPPPLSVASTARSAEEPLPPRPATDPSILLRAAQLLGEAQAFYQNAAGKEGREDELRTARERLDRVLEILEPLWSGDEEVRKLRRRAAQLLSDVARASPF